MKYTPIKSLFFNILIFLMMPLFLLAAVLPSRRRNLLIWGSAPLINSKYWSAAMREVGYQSETIMEGYFALNAREDFDHYFEDFAPNFLPMTLRRGVGLIFAFVYVLRRSSVVHTNFDGFAFGRSIFWRWESYFYRLAGIKTVVLSYGADAYCYSQVIDTSLRHGLLASYPQFARTEWLTQRKVAHWNLRADAMTAGLLIDGKGRWDITTNQHLVIDTREWFPKADASIHDGHTGTVRVLHTPNHRGFKGTEFLVEAVETLKREGLKIELVLLENVANRKVREIMQNVDILAEQFIATGYGLSGIEGMASGLPVMANLEHEAYTKVFRRYGFLNECPVVSTSPETMLANLRFLVENPALRRELGVAGLAFARKYHSFTTAQFMFEAIYDRILNGKEVDLINLFHPLKSSYNHSMPFVRHPLVESRIPSLLTVLHGNKHSVDS